MNKSYDLNGVPYLRFKEAQEGVSIIVDEGFSCMEPWSEKVIKFDEGRYENPPFWNAYKETKEDCLYIDCNEVGYSDLLNGRHYINGQFSCFVEQGEIVEFYVGLYLKSSFTKEELENLRKNT